MNWKTCNQVDEDKHIYNVNTHIHNVYMSFYKFVEVCICMYVYVYIYIYIIYILYIYYIYIIII